MDKLIYFKENKLGISRTRAGLQIGHLAAVPEQNGTWSIYSLISRSKFFNPVLPDKETAIAIAKRFCDIYGEYLLIPQAWDNADVIMLARYSVDNGLNIEALHKFDTLTENQINSIC